MKLIFFPGYLILLLLSFICFTKTKACIEPPTPPPPEKYTIECVSPCPEGWVKFKNTKCFKLFQTPKSQSTAESSCKQLKSTLVGLTSDEEGSFLRSYIAREVPLASMIHVWTGGIKKETLWFWSDLSQFNYTDWWPGYPENLGQGPCICLATHVINLRVIPEYWGKMTNFKCDLAYHYICQKYQDGCKKMI